MAPTDAHWRTVQLALTHAELKNPSLQKATERQIPECRTVELREWKRVNTVLKNQNASLDSPYSVVQHFAPLLR